MSFSETDHITIRRGRSLPPVVDCTSCCSNYHCPFCEAVFFKPTKRNRVQLHLEAHFSVAVIHQEYTIHRCGLDCRLGYHYHCPYCQTTTLKKRSALYHISSCKSRPSPQPPLPTPQPTLPTPQPPLPSPQPPLPSPQPTLPTLPSPQPTLPTPQPTLPSPQPTLPSPQPTLPTLPSPQPTLPTPQPTLPTPQPPLPSPQPTLPSPQPPLPSPQPTLPLAAEASQRRPVIQKKCPVCKLTMNTKNLKGHMERKHTGHMHDITASHHLTSECIDSHSGVFTVFKSFYGESTPLHVVQNLWAENPHVVCESQECQKNMKLASTTALHAYRCIHLRSLDYCTSNAPTEVLAEETLTKMVKEKWFGEDEKKDCLTHQSLAIAQYVPLSVFSKTAIPPSKKYISVYEPKSSWYSRLGRVMVVYDTKINTWHCPCAKPKKSCIHKYIAKWHLFQTDSQLFRTARSTEELDPSTVPQPHASQNEEGDCDMHYPPKDELQSMVEYMQEKKMIPAVLPENLRVPSVETVYPACLVPEEMMCQRCPDNVPLSDPVLITAKAKILTSTKIIQDVSTYYKHCHQCKTHYRYQEWKDGLHNFNDSVLLDLPLCFYLRNMLQDHTAVSRVVECLELTTGEHFPPANTVLNAYLHFEALTEHKYAQEKLVDFIITAGRTEGHLKAVISGREPSKWLQKYTQKSSMSSSKKSSLFVPVYFQENEHQKTVFDFLSKILVSTVSSVPILDRAIYVLDVLFPEVTISAIAGVNDVTSKRAEEIFLTPDVHISELEAFDDGINHERKKRFKHL